MGFHVLLLPAEALSVLFNHHSAVSTPRSAETAQLLKELSVSRGSENDRTSERPLDQID